MKNSDKIKLLGMIILDLSILLFIGSTAFARDLVSASTTATNIVKSIVQALAVMGVLAGGGMMQIPGLGDFGKRVLISGLVGCLCAFGAPAFLSLMRTVFGGM